MTSSILMSVVSEETGLHEVFDSDEGYIFEDDNINEDGEGVYLTPDQISFYNHNKKESPIQYPKRFRLVSSDNMYSEQFRFDLSGTVWRNVSDNDLTSLLHAYHATVWVKTLYEWEDGTASTITSHGTGFHIDTHTVLTAWHNVVDFVCFSMERNGRRISEIGVNENGKCNKPRRGRVLRKYVRKQIVTQFGYATITSASKTGNKFGAQRKDDLVLLQVGGHGNGHFVKLQQLSEMTNSEVILIGMVNVAHVVASKQYEVQNGTVTGSDVMQFFDVAPSDRHITSQKFVSIGRILEYDHDGYTLYHTANSWKASSGAVVVTAQSPFTILGTHIGGEVKGIVHTVHHPFLRRLTVDETGKKDL